LDPVTEFLQSRATDVFSLKNFFILLLIEVVLASLIYWHFRKFSESASSQDTFARVLPVVALTTFMVISVVKTSLALSLGLVGALSIVRFRTPIKDPQELAYIFLAIASGIGLAANQVSITCGAVIVILAVITFGRHKLFRSDGETVHFSLELNSLDSQTPVTVYVKMVIDAISRHTDNVAMQRYELHNDTLQISCRARLSNQDSIGEIMDAIRAKHPVSNIFVVDESNTPRP